MGLTTQTYDILTRLAVGNGALVYRAVDKVTHRQVALKLLIQEGDLDHRFNVGGLLADSKRLQQITGAHVCQLLDAYTDEDGPVLVYEYANGMSGAEFPSQRKLDAAQAVDVAAQLISALRSGERQKCPHGDVKPSNIVFMDLPDKRPFTIVLDWGLTAYRTAMADDSLLFLAPERLAGAAASHRADLFSAGAVLVFLYTGKMFVSGKDRAELQVAWQKARPGALSELRPDLPAKLVQWVCSLLELNPEKRPESAVEAFAGLAALNPPPAPVPPESFRERPTPPASGLRKPPPLKLSRPPSGIQKTLPVTTPAPAGSASSASSPAPAAPAASTTAANSPVSETPSTAPAAQNPALTPPKLTHVAMTIGLFLFFLLMVAGSVWFLFFRKPAEEKYLGDDRDSRSVPAVPARTPAPSVGSNIVKTPFPRLTPTPAKKSATPDPKAAAKPKATPTPTPPKPAPQPPPL
jgi:serine/threonine-protein kinase